MVGHLMFLNISQPFLQLNINVQAPTETTVSISCSVLVTEHWEESVLELVFSIL